MAGVGSMLLSHFQTYGTPIMIGKSDTAITVYLYIPDVGALKLLLQTSITILHLCNIGGGVLAHTILGVDYSDSTGEIQ